MYKSLQKFRPQQVEVLKSAVQFASMQQQPNQQGQGRGFQRHFNNCRGNDGDNWTKRLLPKLFWLYQQTNAAETYKSGE